MNKTKRKPYGYWQDASNIKNELSALIKKMGYLPSNIEMVRLGREDILTAIKKYYSFEKIERMMKKEVIGNNTLDIYRSWDRVKKEVTAMTKKLNAFPHVRDYQQMGKDKLYKGIVKFHGGNSEVFRKFIEAKSQFKDFVRQPYGYWKDFKNIETEIKVLIKDLGHFPTHADFKVQNKYHVLGAIKKNYGPLKKVAERMGVAYK
jgi:hypothetical protein